MSNPIGTELVKAIASRDASAIAACFTSDVQLRALVPPGLRERTGATETGSYIQSWFADSTQLELIDSKIGGVGEKVHISYRFRGVEEGKPYVIEQQLYCSLQDGKIRKADLLCSGFLPRPAD